MATQYSNKPIVTDGLVYALDFGNPKSYVSGSSTARSLIYRPAPAKFETLLPGDIAQPAAAYSVRKVVSSYTGDAMMVQSASVSQSIGFDADGNLDTASLESFAGSGDAFVKIWYDQSGNGRDATQGTAANQPQIVSGGSVILENGNPSIKFDKNLTHLDVINFVQNNLIDAFIVSNPLFNNTQSSYITDIYGSGRLIFGYSVGNPGPGIYRGVWLDSNNLFLTNQSLFSLKYNSSSSYIYLNSSLIKSGNAGNFAINGTLKIGSNPGSSAFGGTLQELIYYFNDQSSNRTKIEDNINTYYQIFTSSYNPTPDSDNNFLDFNGNNTPLNTQQSFPGFSYDQGNSTVMYVGETKGDSTVFTQDGTLSIVSTTSSVGFGSPENLFGRSYPASGLKHVTLRFSSGSTDCFINGVPVSASAVLPSGSSIGGGQLNIPLYTGSLGGFQVYNRPLTSDEIYNNYLIAARRYESPELPAVAKPYTLDENAYLFLQSAGITDPIITSSIDTFVRGLKTNNLWDKMIAIYPFVGTGSDGVNLTGSQLWNLKEPSLVTYPLTFTGSWIGSTSGSAPSGSNTNISVNGLTPSQYYPSFNTQSAHISILSYDTPASSSYLMGTGMTEDLAVSTLAGDYGTPAAAYSVRKVRTAYSGALMDVRRSLDNVTSSIGYVETGDLDTGSLLDWVVPGRNDLPGAYDGLAAAYSLRRVSSSYSGSAIQANNGLIYKDIGFTDSGVLDTASLDPLVATGSNVLPGEYSGLAAAYSLRRVSSSYSGDAIEVQSGSVSQSIGFDSLGNLDTDALLTFAGSGDAFVKTWYDQSGNNKNAIAVLDARQPRIVYTGSIVTENGRPALDFDGVDDSLTIPNSKSYFNFLHNGTQSTVIGISKLLNNSSQDALATLISNHNFNAGSIGYSMYLENRTVAGSPNKIRNSVFNGLGGGTGFVCGNEDTNISYGENQNLYIDFLDVNNATATLRSDLYTNGVGPSQNNPQTGTATTSDASRDMSFSHGTFRCLGTMQEILIYSSSQADNRTYIENNINAYYDIYTTSSTSTENAYVNTWYDQSGNGRHATQTTSSKQPLIVSAGSLIRDLGNYPSILFESARATNLDASSASIPQDSNFAIVSLTDSITNITYAYRGTGPNCTLYLYPTLGTTTSRFNYRSPELASGTFDVTSPASLRVLNTAYRSGTTFGITRNGNLNTTTQTVSQVMDTFHIGSLETEIFNGRFTELLIYHSDQSTNRPLIENNINNYYNIYTGSNHGFVERWYDQSGNNRHAVQTATGSQPIIVESGSILTLNSKPVAKGGQGYAVQNPTTHTDISTFTVGRGSTIFNIQSNLTRSIMWVSSVPTTKYFYIEMSGNGAFANSVNPNYSIINGLPKSTSLNRGQVATEVENQSLISLNWNNINSQINILGSNLNDYNNYDLQEIIFYPTDQSSNREPIEYGINDYYNIYPQTSSFTTSSFTIKADSTSISGSLNNKLTSGIQSSGPLGLVTVSRTGSDSLTIARNGSATSFSVPASGALSTGLYLGAINNNGTALGNSPLNLSFASVGTGLTNSETSTLSTLTHTLRYSLRGLDPDAVSFLAATVLTNETQIQAVNNLVLDLKANNLWDKMTAIYPFVGASGDTHKYNLKNPTQFTVLFEGGWNHTNTGAATNGVNTRGNTQISPSAHLVQDDTHISIYTRSTLNIRDNQMVDVGGRPGSFFTVATWYGRAADYLLSDIYSNNNRITYSYPGVSNPINGLGYFIFQRTSPTSHTVYKNATLLGTNSNSTGGTLPSAQMWIGANGTISEWSDREYSFISFGRGFTPTEVTTLTSIIQTYQTSLSRQI